MFRLHRVALGVTLTGLLVAAVPAIASADPTCGFNAATRTATVFDDDAADPVVVTRFGDFIAVHGKANPFGSLCSGSSGTARIDNTDLILVKAISHKIPGGSRDGVVVDESNGTFGPGYTKEVDGMSEIEVSVQNVTPLTDQLNLSVIGTPDEDIIRIGDQGIVNFGLDLDDDIRFLNDTPASVTVSGGSGSDFLDGRGDGLHGVATVPLTLNGGDNEDTIHGGAASDHLNGDAGIDHLFSVDHTLDFVTGGTEFDDAVIDTADRTGSLEAVSVQPLS
jgi:hypothetical protein